MKSSYGTGRHGKGPDGRSPQIESYMDAVTNWIFDNTLDSLKPFRSAIDLGCDYGYMLHRLHYHHLIEHVVGVDAYFDSNPFNASILREDMASPLLRRRLREEFNWDTFELITLNHSLEHVTDPHAVLSNVRHLAHAYSVVFVAVPDVNSAWGTWDSHLSAWTPNFLDHVMRLHGFAPLRMLDSQQPNPDMKCFRDNLNEIWGLYGVLNG